MCLCSTVACRDSLRPDSAWSVPPHILPAPLLPKLRGHFAEFLLRKSLEHLRLLASPTCVGLRYGRGRPSPTGLFSAVGSCIPLRGLAPPSASALDYPGVLTPGNVYRLASAQPPADGLLAPASPLAIERT